MTRAHYFSALLPRKCSLINQSTDSVIEKSPTWLNLHSPICCPVECLIEPACRTRLMRSTHTCQARSMNHRKITEDFLDSNLTEAFSIWMYLRPFGATDDRQSPVILGKLFRWHPDSPGGWFVIIKPSVIIFVMIAQVLMQGPSCWKSVPWFATGKIKSDIRAISMKLVRGFESKGLPSSSGLMIQGGM